MINKIFRTENIITSWDEDNEIFTVTHNSRGLPTQVQAKRGRWVTQQASFIYDEEDRFVGLAGRLRTEMLPVLLDIAYSRQIIWKDMLATVGGAAVPNNNAPLVGNFGPTHTPQRREYAFLLNDYVFIQPFHTNHDIVPNGEAYLHVHWSTNGTSTGRVRWEITTLRAKGHNQQNFGTPIVTLIEESAHGTAWRHMISETTTPLIMTEPDELISVTLRRVAPTVGSNTDSVFALMVDLHYQADRTGTPFRSPNFYFSS